MILRFLFCSLVLFFPTQAFSQSDTPVEESVVQEATSETEEQLDQAVEEAELKIEIPHEADEPSTLRDINSHLFSILFFDVSFGAFEIGEEDRFGNPVMAADGSQKRRAVGVPLVVSVLAFGAIFFTFFYGFVNLRGFWHAIQIVRGKYDDPHDKGEISHFRALTSALSATVGLGNIAGVAVAIQTGGPGAVVWMMLIAVFGMSSKFSSCTLAQLYRKVNDDGSISGGPMYYLEKGLAKKGIILGTLGKALAVLFAFMIMGGAIGGGNMFQANQTVEAFHNTFGLDEGSDLIIGAIMAIFVGAVILGGIKRIGAATSRIVPFMCGLYVVASLFVIFSNITAVPAALSIIFSEAISGSAFFGGVVGIMVTGIQRAAFSNEAGLGSAAIAHAAAKTDEPVREGLVAMLEPFIDTIIVCLMTSLVVVITGTYANPEIVALGGDIGVTLTTEAFRTVLPWFPYVLTICIALFAYSTMISWCYYGERGWIYLMEQFGFSGTKSVAIFRMIFICAVMVGATHPLRDVIDFTDAMVLGLALPNIFGSLFLAKDVRKLSSDYFKRLNSGMFTEESR